MHYEEQDSLIQDGIELLCTQVNTLQEILKKHGLDLEFDFRELQKRWQAKMIKLHRDLWNWELEYVGQATFSKAFEPVINHLIACKVRAKETTISSRSRSA